MMLLNLIITITLKVDHLLRLGGGTSGVAGLALLDGVFLVLFLFGEFSGVFAWRALLVCLFSNCLLSVFSPFPCFAPKYWKKRRGVSTYIIHIPVPSIFVVFKEWTFLKLTDLNKKNNQNLNQTSLFFPLAQNRKIFWDNLWRGDL